MHCCCLRYFDWVVESVLEEPEDGCAEELELAPDGLELEPLDGAALELDEELESLGCVVEPAPAEPLGEPELDGAALDEDEEPPLASFFWMSTEVDDELEPDGAGAAVVPEAELEEPGALVAPEPDGVVAEDDEDPAGAREAPLSDLLQPAIIAPPNAREIARASVETFMWPPWLGYR